MKNKKGFTLIELLAVIVILGVLLAVAIPNITKTMNTSKEKAAKDNALMIIKAIESCDMAENKICSSEEVKTYYEGTATLTLTNTTSVDGHNSLVIVFDGYNITLKSSVAGTGKMSFSGMKSAINTGSFSSKALTNTNVV